MNKLSRIITIINPPAVTMLYYAITMLYYASIITYILKLMINVKRLKVTHKNKKVPQHDQPFTSRYNEFIGRKIFKRYEFEHLATK